MKKAIKLLDALSEKYSDKLYDSIGQNTADNFEADCDRIKQTLAEGVSETNFGNMAQQEPPAWWPAVENILKEYGLQAIDFVADFKAALAEQPAQRKPLTLREIGAACGNFSNETIKVVRQTEAAHNIKEQP